MTGNVRVVPRSNPRAGAGKRDEPRGFHDGNGGIRKSKIQLRSILDPSILIFQNVVGRQENCRGEKGERRKPTEISWISRCGASAWSSTQRDRDETGGSER